MVKAFKKFLILFGVVVLLLSSFHPVLHAEDVENEENKLVSIAMLNYLTVLNQEINSQRNNKLYMEEVYSTLIGNIFPNAVDKTTQRQLNNMLDTIEKYRMINVKRERLEYLYEQNQAQAIRDAVPDPLAVLNTTMSMDWKKMISSIVYMAVDSKTSYDSAISNAEKKYLQDGWELDDEAEQTLNNSRQAMFNYQIEIVGDNKISGDLTLGEAKVLDFVEIKNNDNDVSRIDFLVKKENDYKMFGGYWLLLAESYYNTDQFDKCITSIDKYLNMDIRIFRQDYDLAKVLPLAIHSVQESKMSNDKKENKIRNYVEILIKNIKWKDWALRYFAAQTYLFLNTISHNQSDLKTAYELALDNVNFLVSEQKKLNNKYITPIKDIENEIDKSLPNNPTKSQKKEVSDYKKILKENRKSELPPILEPLFLNLELMKSLSNKIVLSDYEKTKLEKILFGNNLDQTLFLNSILNDSFKNSNSDEAIDYEAVFDKGIISVPVSIVSSNSTVKTVINSDGNLTTFDDWQVKEVKRNNERDFDSYVVSYTSDSSKKYSFKDGDIVEVHISMGDSTLFEPIIFRFKVKEVKKLRFLKDLIFEKVE